jgi:hypothetical protein
MLIVRVLRQSANVGKGGFESWPHSKSICVGPEGRDLDKLGVNNTRDRDGGLKGSGIVLLIRVQSSVINGGLFSLSFVGVSRMDQVFDPERFHRTARRTSD